MAQNDIIVPKVGATGVLTEIALAPADIGAAAASHAHAIADVTNLQTTLDGKQASGSYATLVGGTVPANQLPSYVDDVLEFSNLAGLPVSGETGKIYVTVDTNKTYRWSGSSYVEISASPGSTDAVPEGSTNLYFTNARVVAAAPPANLNYQSAIADAVVSTQVGGATPQPASTWKTRTLSQSLDTILFPTVLPSISTPKSATLFVSGNTAVQEVGSSAARTLTATFNRGRITNGDGSLGPELVGSSDPFVYTGTGIGGATGSNSLGSVAVVLGSNQWGVSIFHGAGSGAYFDNKGNASTALDGSRAAGTVTASTSAFTGVYPWYHLKSPVTFTAAQFAAAITAGSATNIHASAVLTKVIASASGTISIPYNVNNQFVGAAYEATLTTKTLYYVTALDNGGITALFNGVVTQNNVTTALWTRNYKMHISKNALTNSNTTLELKNA